MHRILSKSLLTSIIFSLALILLVGCVDDLRNRSVFDCEDGEAVIRFSVEDVVLTRDGESQDFESMVDHAYLLFYASDASLETYSPVAAVKAESDPALPGNLKFKMPLILKPNTDYQLLAIANADNYVPAGFNNYGEYLEAWCKTSSTSEKQPIHLYSSLRISPESNLPMIGRVTGNSVFRFSIDDDAYHVTSSLSFRRMVARVDVANIVQDGFKIEAVALCNWRDAVSVAYSNDQLGNRFGMIMGALSEEGATISEDSFVDMPVSDSQEIQQLNREIYCFPSISYDSRIDDEESTALIIKAKYGTDTESTYYRVNVGMRGNVSEVKPNTKYLVTIQSVKGRGASSPEEAYRATESLVVLSVVEGWDIEGNAFAMDDDGNFIVLSKGSLEFEGDATENIEVRVLTSRGLNWAAECVDDDEADASAFVVTKLSDTALAIRPNGENENDSPLTGVCRVSAVTANGNTLTVNISLCQAVKEEKPYNPVIPADMPFALVPDSYDRVKIDHEKKTIEIDGFDPNCFNSFIDIPFKVYINESISEASAINISATLEWPLEGRISTDASMSYTYCQETFAANTLGQVYSPSGTLTAINKISPTLRLGKDDEFYISVGAMGPDDPAIVRDITLSANGESIEYNLIIKPRPAIIDDVVLKDDSGNYWLVQDRNVQDYSGNKEPYVGRLQDGSKYQAYNYSKIYWYSNVSIPFKYQSEGTLFDETFHSLYIGKIYKRSSYGSPEEWLKKYAYESDCQKTSPFYEKGDISDWNPPTENMMILWQKNLKVSKMRMFFVSDVPAVLGKINIPICSYLPYECAFMGDSGANGYFYTNDGGNPKSLCIFYVSNNKGDSGGISTEYISNIGSNYGFTRLVRSLTNIELEDYKQNYLGYRQSLKLTLCHPDTYTSEGWLAK